MAILFSGFQEWKETVSKKIVYQVNARNKASDSGDEYAKYDEGVKALKKKLRIVDESDQNDQVQEKRDDAKIKNQDGDFNIENEVDLILASRPWQIKALNDQIRQIFKKKCGQFINASLQLLEEAKYEELDDFLQLPADADNQLFVVAYNNALEDKNSKRAENVRNGTHVDGLDSEVANKFIYNLLRDSLINWAKNVEQELQDKFN